MVADNRLPKCVHLTREEIQEGIDELGIHRYEDYLDAPGNTRKETTMSKPLWEVAKWLGGFALGLAAIYGIYVCWYLFVYLTTSAIVDALKETGVI